MPLSMAQVPQTQQHAASASYPNNSQYAGKLSMVFRVRQRNSKAILKEHRLICFPTSFSKDTEGRTQLYYTLGGVYVDTPATNGVGIAIFNISGHTLYKGIAGSTGNAGPGVSLPSVLGLAQTLVGGQLQRSSVIDGAAAIKDLEETILAYFGPDTSRYTPYDTRPGDLILEFLNLNTPTSEEDPTGLVGYVIHPHRNLVTLRQDASKPFLWFYQLQFAGLSLLDKEPTSSLDTFVSQFTSKKSLIGTVLDKLNGLVDKVNTFRAAFDMVTQQITGPISSFINGVANLSGAVQGFVGGIEAKIRFPLYAAQSLRQSVLGVLNLPSHVLQTLRLTTEGLRDVLGVPSHSVQTLRLTAEVLSAVLNPVTVGQSVSIPGAGTVLTAGVNDQLSLAVNGEPPQPLLLGNQTSGPAIAQAIQDGVRAMTPAAQSNASAYRDFSCIYTPEDGRYILTSGTIGQDNASVVATGAEDLPLEPNDAAAVLGLGQANGGTEQPGSSAPLDALAILRDVILACERLEAFPGYFADDLPAQSAMLQAVQTQRVPGEVVQGDQFMTTMLLTPGDTLQSIAGRVGLAWETLALANHLAFPYVVTAPTTLSQGRADGGGATTLIDLRQYWTPQRYQGQRLDLVAGPGAGQTRNILGNTPNTLLLDVPWAVEPTGETWYAIRLASNPLIQTGQVSAASASSLSDAALSLVPEAQRDYVLRLITGPAAGQERRIALHTRDTYRLERAWDAVPTVGSTYVIAMPQAPVRRTVLYVGEPIAIPRPARQRTPRSVLTSLESLATMTGRVRSQADKLFGTDLRLDDKTLQIVPRTQDVATISGLDNLRQAVLDLLNLSLGELDYAPGLGSYLQESLGLMATLPSQVELLHSVDRTVRQDARILSVGQAGLSTMGGHVEIHFQALAITGDTLDRVSHPVRRRLWQQWRTSIGYYRALPLSALPGSSTTCSWQRILPLCART